jgi:hypothetical protein
MIPAQTTPRPGARYVRHVAGADFSLEANTEAALQPDRFYLLRNGAVLLESGDYSCVEAAYKRLCREYWESQLASERPPARLCAAWGLLGLDPLHPAAAAVIRGDGTAADCRRMDANCNRRRAQERYSARGSHRLRR